MPIGSNNALALIDSHVHLSEDEYREDLAQLLSNAERENIACMVVPATNLASWSRVLFLAATYKQLMPALGLQPHDAKEYTPDLPSSLERHCSEIVAIGEIGLDFHYDLSPRPIQIESFRAHLEVARAHNLPVILHCRDAEEPFLRTLREVGIPQGGVVHCCTCAWDYVKQFLDLGLHIGVTGMVTFPKLQNVHTIARDCPADRLLVETDGPYLAPIPHRGKRNAPAYVRYVAQAVAKWRGLNEEEICQTTTHNAIDLFGPRLQEVLN